MVPWPRHCKESVEPLTFIILNQKQTLPALTKAKTALQACENGIAFYSNLQLPEGHWGCEYGGPMFLLPGLVIALYVTDTRLSRPEELEIVL